MRLPKPPPGSESRRDGALAITTARKRRDAGAAQLSIRPLIASTVRAMRLALLACMLVVSCSRTDKTPPAPPPAPSAPSAPPAPSGPPPDSEVAPKLVPVEEPARKLWTAQLLDAATFDAYSEQLGGEKFAKFVIDLKSDAIYYFDVNVYKVHKDFIFQVLYQKPKTKAAVRAFDKNYGVKKTDFLMCYLVHHLAADLWTFAFWDGDLATAEHVRHAYRRMKETFYLGDQVKFRPDSNHQEKVALQLTDVPVIQNDQIYQATDYVAFNPGVAVGTLRLLPPSIPASELTFDPSEIVVLPTPLADITPVAGIISEQFSTPLSHVSLRAHAWGIPSIGLRGAAQKLEPFDGAQVYFEARGADYTVRAATEEELAAQKALAEKHVTIPAAELTTTRLATLSEMTARDVVVYGTKAANLGEIVAAHLTGFDVPPGFGVPFSYYDAHLKAGGIDQKIAAMLADPAFAREPSVRKQKLAALQKAIIEAPVAGELRAQVDAALKALPGAEGGVFVRSSTNAEDLPEFNGAGLYDTIPNQHGTDDVLSAIKKVWSSVWNYAAYEDRQRAGIAHEKVYAGSLVQVGVPATAAGVLVTQHPTDPTDKKNYTINAKSGLGMAVVDGKKVPETLIVSWYNHGIRVLSRSAEDTMLVFDSKGGVREVENPNKGKPVLSNAMAIALAEAAKKLTRLFRDNRLDIEWVYAGDKLYIVQTRPLVR